jgi:dTDP-4-amino-4,6-dideoxygalactose transaminase
MWKWGPGDEVLAPAYYCGTEIDALRANGVAVTLYRVDANLRIDVDHMRAAVSRSTRAVYVTHYFGFPQDLRDVRALCDQAGLKLIEDCALSLFSKDGDIALGTLGDAAIYSLAKSLPVPDGGALCWRGGSERGPALRAAGAARVFRGMLPLVKRSLLRSLRRSGIPVTAFAQTGPDSPISREMPASYYFDRSLQDRCVSRVALGVLGSLQPEDVVARRRRNFNALQQQLQDVSKMMVFERLPEGVCPLVLPLRVPDRDTLVRQLSMDCIDAVPWWAGYHKECPLHAFPEAQSLKDFIVALPVHQDLDDRDMEWIANRVVAALRNKGSTSTLRALSPDEVGV